MPKSPTLSRLIFQVRPECMDAFEAVFDAELMPVLLQYGLVPADESGRKMAPNFFGRLFVHDSVADIVDIKAQLQNQKSDWEKAVQQHKDMLIDFIWESYSCLWRFDPYWVPAGLGTRTQSVGNTYQVGPGKGHWEYYGISDGLLSVNVMSMLTDQRGYLWIGTEKGVARFDSRNWRTFEIADQLHNIKVSSMCEDDNGHIWFGISGQGAVCYDGSTFEHFDIWDTIVYKNVRHIVKDCAGLLWFATECDGVFCYDGTSWQNYSVKDGLTHQLITFIYEDCAKRLWIGTEGGLFRYERNSKGGLFHSHGQKEGLNQAVVKTIVEDHNGYLWVATDEELVQFKVLSTSDSEVVLDCVEVHTVESGLPCQRISCAMADDDIVWFGTEGMGVMLYDGHTFHLLDSVKGVADNYVNAIQKDAEGLYWFGTGNGVSRYSGKTLWSLDRSDGVPNNAVLSLAQDSENGIWMGTRKGAAYLEGRKITVFDTDHGLLNNEVRHVTVDRKGHKWFATHGGLTRYDGEVLTTFTVEDGLPHNQVQCVMEDDVGDIWCVTWQGRAVFRYDGETFTTYHLADGLPMLKLWTVMQDKKGTVWVGGHGGLSRYNQDEDESTFHTFTKADGLAHNEVRCVVEDDKERLWISTFEGISMYDGQTFRSYGIEDGLAHDEFRGLLQDRSGYFWFGTYGAGVNRWDPDFEMALAQVMTDRDGLIGNRILSILEDRNGAFWFGTSSGVTRFVPSMTSSPTVQVEAVIADRRYHDVSELTIPNSAEVVAFEFGSVSFKTRSVAVRYRYRLTGFDDHWHVTSDDRVEYYDLPEGDYTFEVYAFDRDLVRSLMPATVFLRVQLANERIAQKLRESEEELLLAVSARDQLDARLQELNYLYALRSKLSDAQTMDDILKCAGSAVAQALDQVGSVVMTLDEQVFAFGKNGSPTAYAYERSIVWNTRTRGHLHVYLQVPLSDAQERMLLDQTVAHVIHALETSELEAQLLQSARLISMGQMAAGVAHELNQPLGAISNVVSDVFLRLRDGIDLSQEDLSQMMQDSMGVVKRMSETINHLRVFSRDEAQAPAEIFGLNDVVQASLKMMGVQLKSHQIDLKLDLQDDLPFVLGHANQMEQVVVNLLANARDAVDAFESGKRIVIKSYCVDDQVIIEVHDNGEGVQDEDLNRVFDPFFTTKEADKGTGLGLSISYAIVKNHGGNITCESQDGETVFRIVLPAKTK